MTLDSKTVVVTVIFNFTFQNQTTHKLNKQQQKKVLTLLCVFIKLFLQFSIRYLVTFAAVKVRSNVLSVNLYILKTVGDIELVVKLWPNSGRQISNFN